MAIPREVCFADMLRAHRKARGLTQEELAEQAGLSRRGISQLESDARRRPYRHTIARLADALRLTDAERDAFETAARHIGVVQNGASVLTSSSSHVIVPMHATLAARRSASATALVGRVHELALLERHLATDVGDVAPLLLLAGEPGIGKSRLLAETAVRARDAGWRVLAGGCVRSSGQAPYEPFVTLLAHTLATTPARQRLDLTGCAWLTYLLPELRETAVVPAPTWTLPPEQERRLMFAAVARYLSNIAGPAGVMLLLDDLQWAGADAVDLLVSLTRGFVGTRDAGLGRRRVRIVGAYRSTEVDALHPLALQLPDLARDGLLQEAPIGLLTPEEARGLLAALLADGVGDESAQDADGAQAQAALIESLARRAGGVPYFLVSCAQEARQGLWAELGGAQRASSLPWDVALSIQARASALGVAALEVLRAAAVIGRIVPHALLAAVMTQLGQPERELTDALEDADRARLLIAAAEDASAEAVTQPMSSVGAIRYQFAHDLAREAILADLAPAKRVALHRAVAETIERLPESERARWTAELADHFTRAGELARALPYALLAGDRAMAVYAHVEAERHYRAVRELAREVGDQRREAAALERLVRVLCILRRFEEAFDAIAQGIAVYGALGDIEGEARMVWRLGWAHFERGTPREGVTRLPPLLEDLRRRGLSPQAVVWLQLALSILCDHSGKGATFEMVGREALATAEQVLAFARGAGDTTLLADALSITAYIHLYLGHEEAALTALEEVVALDAPVGEGWGPAEALTVAVYTPKTLAYLNAARGRFDMSRRLFEHALVEAHRTGHPLNIKSVYTGCGWLAFYTGDWAQARADFEQAQDAMRKVENVADDASLRLFVLSVAEGHAEVESAELLERLARCAKEHNHSPQCAVESMLAERDVLDGQFEAARDRLQSFLDEYHAELDKDDMIHVLTHLAWASLGAGEVARAEKLMAESRSRAESAGYHLWLVDALRVEALIRIAQHRWREAEAALEEALILCRAMPYPYAELKALWVYGKFHTARGETELARLNYHGALTICDDLGEGLYRPHIEQALKVLSL
jgi:transcriptional regulator with XRE-family HTH domain/tetratricopeptide (TPR) repeat protein